MCEKHSCCDLHYGAFYISIMGCFGKLKISRIRICIHVRLFAFKIYLNADKCYK